MVTGDLIAREWLASSLSRRESRFFDTSRAHVHREVISANDVLRYHKQRWMFITRAWCCYRGLSIASCLSSLLKESEGCKEIIDKPPFPRDNIHCGLRRRSYRQLKVILRNHIYVFFLFLFFLQSQAVKS